MAICRRAVDVPVASLCVKPFQLSMLINRSSVVWQVIGIPHFLFDAFFE
jgi:hypothetical protein